MIKRILMINDHIHFGGGGDAVFRLERLAYEEAGHEVYTFSQAITMPKDISDHDYVCLVARNRLIARVGKFSWAPKVNRALENLLKKIQPDLVRVHLVSKFPLSIYSALRDYKVIQTLHGPNLFCATSWGNIRTTGLSCELGIGMKCWQRGCTSFQSAALYKLLDFRLRPVIKKNVQLYHCPSKQIQLKSESLGYTPTVYIPLGVSSEFIEAKLATHDGDPIVLYVGSLIEEKGVLLLPEFLKIVKNSVPRVKLLICGQGGLKNELVNCFKNLELSENVEFKGFVSHTEIVDLYRNSQVFVCPSIYSEQFGLVGVEALACGVPCVGSDVGGIPEWLHDGEWGYLVPPRDHILLANKVIDLLLNRQKRLFFGKKGRDFVIENHNPDKYKQKWLQIIDEYT